MLAEALEGVNRDQEHTAGIWKSLAFADFKLVTPEDEITELHVGLEDAMNALFLKDLAAKTHRGRADWVEAGKLGGGLFYGYRITRQLDARGEPVRGDRMIDPDQAPVVQRIFALFGAGSSPIAIAKTLNRECVPGPGGQGMAGHYYPRPSGPWHRDPAQRALYRPAALEPHALHSRSSERQACVAHELVRQVGHPRHTRPAHHRSGDTAAGSGPPGGHP